jgi:hypothetical protein
MRVVFDVVLDVGYGFSETTIDEGLRIARHPHSNLEARRGRRVLRESHLGLEQRLRARRWRWK